MQEHFKDFKFKGKGHESEDLDAVMAKMEHWAYRLFPKFKFDDTIAQIEKLGDKKNVKTHAKRIRLGLDNEAADNVQREGSPTLVFPQVDEPSLPAADDMNEAFDALLEQGNPNFDDDIPDEDLLRELQADAEESENQRMSPDMPHESPDLTPQAALEDGDLM